VAFLAWNFCTASITGSILSVVDNANIIKKVYFPRETLPISVVFANLANFLLALPLVFALMMWYRLPFTPFLLYLPLIVAIQVIFLLGVALILSCINVFLRDTEVIADVLLTAWFFLTPVFYPIEFLPQDWHGFNLHRLMYILNPMASIIASYRSILYGSYDGGPPAPPDLAFLMRTLVTSAAILVIGYIVFIRYSRLFGEEL
jgi:ABC-type polysaccharide/polyol phosphate export permease